VILPFNEFHRGAGGPSSHGRADTIVHTIAKTVSTAVKKVLMATPSSSPFSASSGRYRIETACSTEYALMSAKASRSFLPRAHQGQLHRGCRVWMIRA
jgi:hypothetical protein